MPKVHTLILAMALVLFGAAPVSAAELAGTSWRPIMIAEVKWPEHSQASLQFMEDGHLGGGSECNKFGGSYEVAGSTTDMRAAIDIRAEVMTRCGLFR